MIQRRLATATKSASLVSAGKLASQYLAGCCSAFGHSTNSHCSGSGSLRSKSRLAGRTRSAANRDRSFCFVPVRQVMFFQSVAGIRLARSLARTGWCSGLRWRHFGGRPVPLRGGGGSGCWPGPRAKALAEYPPHSLAPDRVSPAGISYRFHRPRRRQPALVELHPLTLGESVRRQSAAWCGTRRYRVLPLSGDAFYPHSMSPVSTGQMQPADWPRRC